MTYVGPAGGPQLRSCLTEIGESLENILSRCGFYPEEDISITPDGLTRLTITVTSSERRKTPEKNGVL
jgi:hypothetical protein